MERAYIYLNEICNLNCIFCASDDTNFSISKKQFDIGQIRDFIKEQSTKTDTIVISGGEPTLSPNLFEISHLASNYFKNLQLMTNGLKFSDDCYLSELINCGINSLCIPIVSPDPLVFEILVGKKNTFKVFEKALFNVLNYTHKNRPKIQLKTIILRNNLETYNLFPEFLKKFPSLPDYFIVNGLHLGSKVLEKRNLIPDLEIAGKSVSQLIKDLSCLNLTSVVAEFPLCLLDLEAIDLLVETNFPLSASEINTTLIESDGIKFIQGKHVKFDFCHRICILNPFCDGYSVRNSDLIIDDLSNIAKPFMPTIEE
jgi:uncharacterized Fe-S cluster-containing radical SAM superfamily protein